MDMGTNVELERNSMQQPAPSAGNLQPAAGSKAQSWDDALALIEELTSTPESVQHRVLCDILAQNSNTEYLRSLITPAAAAMGRAIDPQTFKRIDPQTFKRVAPVITYDILQPFIQRIADGDTSPILTSNPVTHLYLRGASSHGMTRQRFTSTPESVQHRVLCDILAQNSDTEYLRSLIDHSSTATGAGTIDPQTFKRVAPVITYDDLQPFIQRIADGDTSPILTSHPVTHLYLSSGTSGGQRKLYPAHFEGLKLLELFRRSMIRKHVNGVDDGKELIFFTSRPGRLTSGGLPAQSISTFIWNSPEGRQHIKRYHTSPAEVHLECEDLAQSTYCQLLCGLVRREEVKCVGSLFASGLIWVLHLLQDRWHELVEDIRAGCLNTTVVSDLHARTAMEAIFHGPNPKLAMQVEAECCQEPMWKGIISRLWPCAKYVSCVTTGSMQQYIPELQFLAGDISIVSSAYVSSECPFGINLSPLCSPYEVSYTLLPNMAYFEFLPLHGTGDDDHHEHPIGLLDVKLGQEYEIVVTTFEGLYRYLVGDVLQVTGFYNKTPKFRFVARKNVVLSVDTDKTDEQTLEQAIEAAKSRHLQGSGMWITNYTSYVDVSSIPGHYVVFWEVSSGEGEGGLSCGSEAPAATSTEKTSIFEECAATMEKCFAAVYKLGRRQNRIGALEIKMVGKGSFDALMGLCVAEGAAMSQYKTPRSIKAASLVEFLNSRVSHSFFSPERF